MESQKRISWKAIALFFMVCILALGVPMAMPTTANEVQAATVKQGWVQKNGNWYYYKNGKIQKSKWIGGNGVWYYVKKNGVMAENEFETVNGKVYYLGASGKMVTDWKEIGNYWYYFDKTNGDMKTGFLTSGSNRYYLSKNSTRLGRMMENKLFKVGKKSYYAGSSGALITGFKEVSGVKYYFTTTGAKANGWHKISNKWYYMDAAGAVQTGWFTDPKDGKEYYLSKSASTKGQMYTGTKKIGSKTYYFNSSGALQYEVTGNSAINSNLADTTSSKTIKNYLLNALKPVGSTLYVWGGGWAAPTTNYKGLYPTWKTWYNKNSGSYNYSNYKDLSVSTRAKGLDCSGFVGWSTYQVMQQKSGGPSYVAEASTIASYYAGKGYGTLRRQSYLSQNGYKGKFKAGDVASRSGHTWLVLGQCSDGSVVIVHSTPPCVQIAGSPTPSGNYSSQAVTLAKKYMKKYYGSTVNKFNLGSTTGLNVLTACNTMQWNSKTLSDPDGYRNKSAATILKDLFGE